MKNENDEGKARGKLTRRESCSKKKKARIVCDGKKCWVEYD